MNYQGFCDKYGAYVVIPVSYFAPVALNGVFNAVTGKPIGHGADIALMAGGVGFTLGALAHGFGNLFLSHKGIGMSRGACIVKSFQAAAYGVPVLSGLTYNATRVLER